MLSIAHYIYKKNVFLFSDIYVCSMSHTNSVTAKDYYLAIVSTTVETSDPLAELQPGLQLLGTIQKKFLWVSDQFEPQDDVKDSKVRSTVLTYLTYFLLPKWVGSGKVSDALIRVARKRVHLID